MTDPAGPHGRRTAANARLRVLGAAALFGTGGLAIKATALPAVDIAASRSAVAVVVLWLLMPAWRRFWSPAALAVGLGYAVTMVSFVVSTKWTTAANAILLQSTSPLWVLVLAPLLLGERPRRREVTWTSLVALGLVVIFSASEPAQRSAPDPGFGNLVAIGSGMSWALTLVGLRWLSRDRARAVLDPPPASTRAPADAAGAAVIAGNALACLACAPFAGSPLAWTGADLAAVGWLGVFQIGLAYVLLTRGVREVRATEAALLLLCESAVNTALTWLVLGERPAATTLLGGALILTAAAANALRRAPDAGAEPAS